MRRTYNLKLQGCIVQDMDMKTTVRFPSFIHKAELPSPLQILSLSREDMSCGARTNLILFRLEQDRRSRSCMQWTKGAWRSRVGQMPGSQLGIAFESVDVRAMDTETIATALRHIARWCSAFSPCRGSEA